MSVLPPPARLRSRFASGHARTASAQPLWQSVLAWLPLVVALVYAVGLLVNIGALLHAVYSSADASAVLSIAHSFPSTPSGAKVIYGDVQVLQVLAVLLLTRGLPAYRYVWELLPYVAGLVALGLVARTVRIVSGWWAAAMVMIALGCAGSYLLALQFDWGIHTPAYQDICVFGAVTPLLAWRGGSLGRSRWAWGLWLTLIIVIGSGAWSNDTLFLGGGLVPFAVSAAVTAWLAPQPVRRRLMYSAGTVVIGVVVGGEVLLSVARAIGVTTVPFHLQFAAYNQLLDHSGLLAQSLLVLLNANFGGVTLNLPGAFAFAGAVVVAVAIFLTYRAGRAQVSPLLADRWRTSARVDEPEELARVALLVYWITSAVVLSIGFVCTSAVVDIYGMRYVVSVAYAVIVVATVAIAAHPRARAVAALGVCVLAIGGCISIFRHDPENIAATAPNPTDGAALARWANAEHLHYGYASYWVAAPLSWLAQGQPDVYPVTACGATLCAYDNRISSWYTPQPHWA
jgi:hypothetical protein